MPTAHGSERQRRSDSAQETLVKIERFWGTLWRECLETSVFLDLGEARTRIGHFIDHYNFQRPHQGADGLVPADRFFGAAPEVLRMLKERVAGVGARRFATPGRDLLRTRAADAPLVGPTASSPALPHDFPKWKTVYTIFRRWRLDGTWQRLNEALVRLVRKAAGKKPTPSATILDSQSIRTAEGGECRGYDGGKKITGRKRHLAVDTLGLIWAVVVHGADWKDYEGGHFVLAKLRNLGRLRVVFADSIYSRCGLPDWVSETFGWVLQTVLQPVRAAGFVILPKSWIVERTFAWISRCRRHSKDYERTVESSEAMIYITMIGLMSRRLARKNVI